MEVAFINAGCIYKIIIKSKVGFILILVMNISYNLFIMALLFYVPVN